MDPVRNPFVPGAGNQPPELAGRKEVLRDATTALKRVAIGRHSQSMILVGLRGVGKTVLLVRMKEIAEQTGYRARHVEAHEGKSLAHLLVPELKYLLFQISNVESAKELGRRGLRVLASFVSGLKVTVGGIDFGLTIDAEKGSADSGDLEADLPALFSAVGDAAKMAGLPVALLIDEMQYLSERDFSALIMATHRISQQGLPFMIIGAGLPQILGLAGESKSYAERLFKYPTIGALSHADAEQAIRNPIASEHASIEDEAVDLIITVTECYPYFLQQWGHDSWNMAKNGFITTEDVVNAYSVAIRTLDENFFKVRFDRCNQSEKRYMRALAELGPGSHKSGEIAAILGLKTTSVGPTRGNLIKKGMIYSPAFGDTAFTVPLFDAYMQRVIPWIHEA